MREIKRIINTQFVRPLYYARQGDKRLLRLRELEHSQWASSAELEKLQSKRLRAIIHHCYRTTAYYRALFDRNRIHPDDIQSAADLRFLPTLDKATIQEQMDSMISNAYDRGELIPDASGGSTGMPTNFFKDLERHRLRRADQLRHDQWCGWRLGEPFALLWGAQKDLSKVQSTREKLVARLVDRSFMFDAFSMDERGTDEFLAMFRKVRPTMLIGYANALWALAGHLQNKDQSKGLGLSGVISSAETLSQEKRAAIESALGCQVLNRYGSREVGLIASECPKKSGLHVNFENVVVEVLVGDSPAQPGQSGEIVVTDLMNFGMPFIRYRMGDIGTLASSKCKCGRELPRLSSVEGRVSDFFIGKDGVRIHGEYFTHLFYGVPDVRQFQLIQEELKKVRLKLVTKGEIPQDQLDSLFEEIKRPLPGGTTVSIEYCDDIPPARSGKFLFTISKVSGSGA